MGKNIASVLVCLLVIAMVAGCGSNGINRGRVGAGGSLSTLIVGTTMKVDSISIEDYNYGILRAVFTHMGLIKLNEQGEFVGDLAEKWENEDGLTWVFRLRQGITWHDGQPVTAHDVKFSLEYLTIKSVEYKSHFAFIEKVETPDDYTVAITLVQPNPRFLVNLLVLRILPEHVFAKVEQPAAFTNLRAALGCGPYMLKQFDIDAGVLTFEANQHYYRGVPLIPKVQVKLFKNPDTLYMALQNGDIDMPYSYAAGTDPLYAANLAKNSRLKLLNVPDMGVPKALFFNTSKAPVNEVQVRKALSYAIDYQELVRLFTLENGVIPTAGFVPRGTLGFTETNSLEFNPVKAQAMLEDWGYKQGENGVREKNGQQLAFEILVRNDLAENIRIAELLQKYFAAVGAKVTLKTVDGTLFRTISDKDKSHSSLLSRATPWGMMMTAGMGTGYFDGRNIGWANVKDKQFIDIVDRMHSVLLPEEYYKIGNELQQYYAENLPAIPLYWDSFIQPYNAALTGFHLSPMYGVLNEETWFNLRKIEKLVSVA